MSAFDPVLFVFPDVDGFRVAIVGCVLPGPGHATRSDGWIKHNGGPCPVQKDVLIDFKKRNGREYIGAHAYPNGGDWTYTEKSIGDESIVAWRLAAEKEEKQS